MLSKVRWFISIKNEKVATIRSFLVPCCQRTIVPRIATYLSTTKRPCKYKNSQWRAYFLWFAQIPCALTVSIAQSVSFGPDICPRLNGLHYSDVIMKTMASQIISFTIVYSAVSSCVISKKTPKLRVTGLCEGNSPVTGEFPAQRTSNAENFSIRWRHHVIGIMAVTYLVKVFAVIVCEVLSCFLKGSSKSNSSCVSRLWLSVYYMYSNILRNKMADIFQPIFSSLGDKQTTIYYPN